MPDCRLLPEPAQAEFASLECGVAHSRKARKIANDSSTRMAPARHSYQSSVALLHQLKHVCLATLLISRILNTVTYQWLVPSADLYNGLWDCDPVRYKVSEDYGIYSCNLGVVTTSSGRGKSCTHEGSGI